MRASKLTQEVNADILVIHLSLVDQYVELAQLRNDTREASRGGGNQAHLKAVVARVQEVRFVVNA